jgi:hypothetical protein
MNAFVVSGLIKRRADCRAWPAPLTKTEALLSSQASCGSFQSLPRHSFEYMDEIFAR